MGKIFYIFGKSSTGKDTVYKRIISDKNLALKNVVGYTTRPIRDGEVNGKTYNFVNEEEYLSLKDRNLIVEEETYNTMYGPWRYFTVHDRQMDLEKGNYLMIGVLRSYISIRDYFGSENVIPIYLEVDDGVRLQRALNRELLPENRKFTEMCRRYIADSEDFSEEKLTEAKITRRFVNDDLDRCIQEIKKEIQKYQ